MPVQQVQVVIKSDGEVEIDVAGSCGAQCLDVTRDLELALGSVPERHIKPEAQVSVAAEQTVRPGPC